MERKNIEEVITFVFTDIEHSTQLVQQLKEAYPELLERYRQTIRSAIQHHNGKEIDTPGDGFFMAFYSPEDAIAAMAEVQKAFYNDKWATDVHLKVRMGIHTGKAMATNSGYAGVEVHAASRICDAAYGGQVIVSEATLKSLKKHYTELSHLTDLGDYVIRDINYPVRLYQLVIPGARLKFPKPRISIEEKKIAILPIFNTNENAEFKYVGDGIAEEIIIALSKVRGLRVASRSTSFALRDQKLSAVEMGRKLDVDAVLDGRINIENNHLALSVELIDTHTGLNIWAENYIRKRENLVKIQDDIIQHVTSHLGSPLTPDQVDAIQYRQSHNAEAYDYYLRGRRFYLQFSTRGVELAIRMFEKAIEADENYSLAYAGLADSYAYLYQHKKRFQEYIDKADEASILAVTLAPEQAKAYVSRGIVLSLLGNKEESDLSFETAIEMDPTLFLGWFHYGRSCFANGNLEKAARLFQQANRVEPDDFQSILLSAQVYDDFGSHDFAQILRQRGVEIAYKCLELNPGDTRAMYFAANALALLGKRDESLKLVHTALTLDPEDSMLLYNAGCVYSLLDMKKEALSTLERAYTAGLTLKGWYENDSNLDNLRNEPRFIQLMEKMD